MLSDSNSTRVHALVHYCLGLQITLSAHKSDMVSYPDKRRTNSNVALMLEPACSTPLSSDLVEQRTTATPCSVRRSMRQNDGHMLLQHAQSPVRKPGIFTGKLHVCHTLGYPFMRDPTNSTTLLSVRMNAGSHAVCISTVLPRHFVSCQ
jgi:hypothetical protein